MVYRDMVWPGHWEFVVSGDGSQNQAQTLGRHEFDPLFPMLGINVGKVSRPVDASRLGIAIVHHVVDMAVCRLSFYSSFLSLCGMVLLTP